MCTTISENCFFIGKVLVEGKMLKFNISYDNREKQDRQLKIYHVFD